MKDCVCVTLNWAADTVFDCSPGVSEVASYLNCVSSLCHCRRRRGDEYAEEQT